MPSPKSLLVPAETALLLCDPQAGLAFGVGSQDVQSLRDNLVALAKTARVFNLPIIATTSASKVYSGPIMPKVQAAIPDIEAIDRHNINAWEDERVRTAVEATGRKRLLIAGLLTEACVSFPALSAVEDGYDVFVVADACGALTPHSHDIALRRLQDAGVTLTTWMQVLLELQRDWTRHETYDGARGIVEEFGGGYGIGLAYARDMIRP